MYTVKCLRGKLSFPTNYGLVDWQYKPTSMLPWKFSSEQTFSIPNAKVFPLKCFVVSIQYDHLMSSSSEYPPIPSSELLSSILYHP